MPQSIRAVSFANSIATQTGTLFSTPSLERRRVGPAVKRRIGQQHDAAIDLRELADERASDRDRAVEIGRAIALLHAVERGAKRADVRRRRQADTRRSSSEDDRGRVAFTQRAPSTSSAPFFALAKRVTPSSPRARMLIESSSTIAIATEERRRAESARGASSAPTATLRAPRAR